MIVNNVGTAATPRPDGALPVLLRVQLGSVDRRVLADISIPGGAGWSVRSGGAILHFSDKAGRHDGIVKFQVRDRSKTLPDE